MHKFDLLIGNRTAVTPAGRQLFAPTRSEADRPVRARVSDAVRRSKVVDARVGRPRAVTYGVFDVGQSGELIDAADVPTDLEADGPSFGSN